MKQSTQEKLSDIILDWRDAEQIGLLDIPYVQEAENPFVLVWDKQKIKDKHVGCRLVFSVVKRNSLIHFVTMRVIEELKRVLEVESLDYIEVVRIQADDEEDERLAIEIIVPATKKHTWVLE